MWTPLGTVILPPCHLIALCPEAHVQIVSLLEVWIQDGEVVVEAGAPSTCPRPSSLED